MRLSPDNLQLLLMLAGVGLLCWLMVRGKLRRRAAGPLPVLVEKGHDAHARHPATQFTGTHSLGAPAEVLRWQVELHDLARELKAELDSKLIAVRTMTTAYDQAARRLGEMIRLAEQVQLAPDSPVAEARRLSRLGWTTDRIASVLKLSESEVQQLLS